MRVLASICFVYLVLPAACSAQKDHTKQNPIMIEKQKEESSSNDKKSSKEYNGIYKRPCYRNKGNIREHVGWRNCLLFLPAKKMQGVWIHDLEESSFIPGKRSIPKSDDPVRFRIYLDVDAKEVQSFVTAPLSVQKPSVIFIEFVGRQSKGSGPFYTGENDSVVVVDRIIRARHIGTAPTPELNYGDSLELR